MPGVPEPDQAWWGTTVFAVSNEERQISVEARIVFDVEELASEEKIFKYGSPAATVTAAQRVPS